MARLPTLLAIAIATAPAGISAQPYRPVRFDTAPVFDGRVDDPAWLAVEPLPMTMAFPVFRGSMTIDSEIRLAYDEEFLYASGRFESADPIGRSLARDRASDSDEMFGLVLDTFDDNENALLFITTPAGIRIDQTVFGDAQPLNDQMPVNESWNTFWDVAVHRTTTGWEAEMRIPWSSLRFQDEEGRVTMGLLTWRWCPAATESHTFPEIDPRWGLMGPMKPSIAHTVIFEGVFARHPAYITPYMLGGFSTEADQPSAGNPWVTDTDPAHEVGLDVKYSLTSNMTLDATLNTDFAQVEADDRQVNLTRFSLFFPEKRQFFQERSSVFEFNTGGQTRLFYSRTIGLSDEGPVRLLGGGRIVGRVGGWDLGILNLQTGREEFSTDDGRLRVPSENFGVVRVRRRVLNPYSYAGGIVTTRLGENGTYNVAYGMDGTIRIGRQADYLLLGWAQTLDDTTASSPVEPASGLYRVRLERRTSSGMAWEIGVTRAGGEYVPDMGFIFRTDFTRLGDRIYYSWQPDETSPFHTLQLGVRAESYWRNHGGSLESVRIGPELAFQHRGGAFGTIAPVLYLEDLNEPFELDDDLEVPAGRYRFGGIGASIYPSPRPFRIGFNAEAGSFYDGWRVSIGVMPTWNMSRHIELGGEYQANRVGFPTRDRRLNADIARVRVRAALDTRLSLSAFIQYATSLDELAVNARMRFNIGEGSDLYVVYNEGLNTRRGRERPRLPATDARAVLVKFTYTIGG